MPSRERVALKIMLAISLVSLIALIAAPVMAAGPPAVGSAPVRGYAECLARTDADPTAGREAAAEWKRFGGGVPALICEALALSALGADDAAARALDDAATREPDLTRAQRAEMLALAAQFWLGAGRGDEADASATAALAIVPRQPDALRARGAARIGAARFAAAAVDLSAALDGAPDDAGLWVARARARAGMFDHAGSADDAARALALAPDLAEAWLLKGLAEVALDRTGAAQTSLMAAIGADGAPPGGDIAARARATIQRMALAPR